jgi:hypothetical protein
MEKNSFIYSNIRYYRFVMSLLYKGNYYERFRTIIPYIEGNSVTELCFGDTIIADYCRKNGISWTGLDINESFVENARRRGFTASKTDLNEAPVLPNAETCIISGSLYHFHDRLDELFSKILASAPLLIISEPVRNLSDNHGIIGKLAKASATVDGKEQPFRYTDQTLKEALESLGKKMNFRVEIRERFSKDRIVLIRK